MEKNQKIIVYGAIIGTSIAIGLFLYTIHASAMLSYLSNDPKACINCHVMHQAYKSWDNSSHKNVATCVECHLPVGNEIAKYTAKAIDGWNHSVAFTLNTYKNNIKISENAAQRVQTNCIRCHSSVSETVQNNASFYHNSSNLDNSKKCWNCHKYIPHGKVRALTSAPNPLGIKEHLK